MNNLRKKMMRKPGCPDLRISAMQHIYYIIFCRKNQRTILIKAVLFTEPVLEKVTRADDVVLGWHNPPEPNFMKTGSDGLCLCVYGKISFFGRFSGVCRTISFLGAITEIVINDKHSLIRILFTSDTKSGKQTQFHESCLFSFVFLRSKK